MKIKEVPKKESNDKKYFNVKRGGEIEKKQREDSKKVSKSNLQKARNTRKQQIMRDIIIS